MSTSNVLNCGEGGSSSKDLVPILHTQLGQVRHDGIRFQFPSASAAAVRHDPPAAPAPRMASDVPDVAVQGHATVDARAQAALLASIAVELSDVGQIAASIAARPRARRDLDGPYRAPSTTREKQLAEMFGELLGVEEIGVDDNFFSLGGHSLLAVTLISRLRDAFQVEIPLAILFEIELTVAEVARTVRKYRMLEGTPEASTEVLMQLLETLSDDEVRMLKAGQTGPDPQNGGGGRV